MTKEYRLSMLNEALRQSRQTDSTVVLLLDGDKAIFSFDEYKACELAKMFGYTVYAKCKHGYLIL